MTNDVSDADKIERIGPMMEDVGQMGFFPIEVTLEVCYDVEEQCKFSRIVEKFVIPYFVAFEETEDRSMCDRAYDWLTHRHPARWAHGILNDVLGTKSVSLLSYKILKIDEMDDAQKIDAFDMFMGFGAGISSFLLSTEAEH